MEHLNTSSEPDIDNDSSYWMSIGDLMSGLMFIFILALSVFMINITDLIDIENERTEILREIESKMKERGFTTIEIDYKQGILRLEQGILFRSGEAELLSNGEKLLSVLGPVTHEVLTDSTYEGKVETIFIEGHTDSVRVSPSNKFQSNWDLSTQRAINTWLFMSNEDKSLLELKNENNQSIFSVSGYAESRPVSTNKTPEGRRKNRRIDFRFNMVTPETDGGIADDISEQIR